MQVACNSTPPSGGRSKPPPRGETNAARPPRRQRSLFDLTFAELAQALTDAGLRPAHARTLWRALHREDVTRLWTRRSDFLPPLRRWLEANFGNAAAGDGWCAELPEVVAETPSDDGCTRKFLLRLADGATVETVLMGYPGRFTVCVSTQVGCAMGCVFCATGQAGFTRHLRAGEIVAQVLVGRNALRAGSDPQSGLRNLVLMGMGEPLHNYDAVMQALAIITDTRGLNLGPSRITLSTVGVVPGILRLAAERRPYRLAVSLHGASDAERGALVPVNRRWPLAELLAACRVYGERTGRRIFFEWTLVGGVNDSPAHARRLAALLAGLDAHVNLIPLNATAGFPGHVESAAEATAQFQASLRRADLPSTVRQRRGLDVAAGCGQLRAATGVPA